MNRMVLLFDHKGLLAALAEWLAASLTTHLYIAWPFMAPGRSVRAKLRQLAELRADLEKISKI